MPAVTHQLADFALDTRWSALPSNVRAEALRALVNWLGCAVGGSNTPTADAAVRGLGALGRAPNASVLGRREQLDFVDAAVVDCISSSAHTFDDTHLKTITHPTGPVAAALLACAQRERFDGEALLAALAVGMEIECRVATVIAAPGAGSHKGWYMTGLAGGIGAAAAVARVLKLDARQTIGAMSLAAAQAGGTRATHGSMAIAYVPAAAARQGLVSVFLARGGFDCSDIAIDGRNGLLEVVAPGARAGDIVAGLGSNFELLENALKPYPCGIVIHPAIDACLELVRRERVHPHDVERVELDVHPDAMALCWRKLPATPLDAQVSLYHWVAAVLVHGAAGIEQGERDCVEDERVRGLQERIVPRVSTGLASDQAVAEITLKNCQRHRAVVEHAILSIARPMSDADLYA
jgi:2-methylcitrate dehydratase PrpD